VTRGQIYNLGGGLKRAYSVLEMLHAIEKLTGKTTRLEHRAVRPGDQPLYISDTTKLEQHVGWHPRRDLSAILSDIRDFWRENNESPESQLVTAARSAALGEVA
jgi:CDP-paratose 2-epimerase